jgi:hypothetical protein
MEQIDWDKAPEGATHWDTGVNYRVAGWMKLDDGIWYWWPVKDAKCDKKWHASLNQHSLKSEDFIARPSSWSGTGLPPVGTVCEVVSPGYSNDRFNRFVGQVVTVIAHDVIDADPVAVFRVAVNGQADEQDYHALVAKCFRPIRTPGQIAAEQREKAISEMKAVFDSVSDELVPTSNSYLNILFGALHDNGFMKFEIAPE